MWSPCPVLLVPGELLELSIPEPLVDTGLEPATGVELAVDPCIDIRFNDDIEGLPFPPRRISDPLSYDMKLMT